MTPSQHKAAMASLEKLIESGELILWIHHSDGTSSLVDAVSVCANGSAIQIEADPDWKFGKVR